MSGPWVVQSGHKAMLAGAVATDQVLRLEGSSSMGDRQKISLFKKIGAKRLLAADFPKGLFKEPGKENRE